MTKEELLEKMIKDGSLRPIISADQFKEAKKTLVDLLSDVHKAENITLNAIIPEPDEERR